MLPSSGSSSVFKPPFISRVDQEKAILSSLSKCINQGACRVVHNSLDTPTIYLPLLIIIEFLLHREPFVNMWSLIAIAPYAIGLVFFIFVYFVVFPYVENLRDPKGTLPTLSRAGIR